LVKVGNISPATFYKLVNGGLLRIVKLGARTLVPAESLDELAESLRCWRRSGHPPGSAQDCWVFLSDLKSRIKVGNRIQLTTNGFGSYPPVVDCRPHQTLTKKAGGKKTTPAKAPGSRSNPDRSPLGVQLDCVSVGAQERRVMS
jgi:hypothetical protein